MTILPNCPKKKSPQVSPNGEIEAVDNPNNANHLQNISTNNESSNRSSIYLSPQSPPPWPSGSTNTQREDSKRVSHSSPLPYEDTHDSGSSHAKRRYRASPLRSVRPKLREHRGNNSPPYPSTSELWNGPNHSRQINLPTAPTIPTLSTAHSPQAGPSNNCGSDEETTAYNSSDEYESFCAWSLTKEQWEEKERWFEKKMKKKHRLIKKMKEDGACLFRSIADQVFGDQDMHMEVRKQCMDYLEQNEANFHPFVSENFDTYIERKRRNDCFGNHIEISAMSEMYNRVIEVYCYSTEPINIFQGIHETDNAPIRLTYHKGTHYNSLVDPYHATVGVGLGLPGYQPGLADKNLMSEATHQSEKVHIEKAMLEDKIRATDFEATSEAIEEQVAQQSYVEWLRENERQLKKTPGSPNSESSAPRCSKDRPASEELKEELLRSPRRSPRTNAANEDVVSPSAAGGVAASQPVDLAIAGSSKDPTPSSSRQYDRFTVDEKASFLNHLPPDMFGLSDYENEEANILAQVLAASQQEYLDSLKNRKEDFPNSPDNSS